MDERGPAKPEIEIRAICEPRDRLARREPCVTAIDVRSSRMSDEIRELTEADFERAMPRRQRERIQRGEIDPTKDVVALRRFVGLSQPEFAEALGISVHTLRNWEQGRRRPEGPALDLLRVAALA